MKDVEDFGRRDLVALDFADIIGVLREMLNGTACDIAGKLDGLYFVKFLDIARRTADDVVERKDARFDGVYPFLLDFLIDELAEHRNFNIARFQSPDEIFKEGLIGQKLCDISVKFVGSIFTFVGSRHKALLFHFLFLGSRRLHHASDFLSDCKFGYSLTAANASGGRKQRLSLIPARLFFKKRRQYIFLIRFR